MGSERVLDDQALEWAVAPGVPATTEVAGLTGMDAAIAWLEEKQTQLRAALRTHGAVYVRGLPIASTDDFAQVRDTLMPAPTPYREKATPRSDLGKGVFSSTDLPASQAIRMHNENSYTLTFPGLLMFACLVAPEEGGSTPVADCRAVLAQLPPMLVEKMRAQGWLLTRSYSEHISTSWQTAFAANTPADVERYCAENLIACEWQDDGHLRTSQVRPGVITHPATGEEVWFNHLAFWNEWSLDEEVREALIDEFGRADLPFNTGFGHGDPVTQEELAVIEAAYRGATKRRPWEPGGLLLVDNILTTHGRDPFRGDRRIVVAMGDPVDVVDCRPTVPPAAAAAAR